jgi:hypothetical protein
MLALLLLILMGSFVMVEDMPQTLFDFTGADAEKDWQTVNDGVMGGVSVGKFQITDKKTLEFSGTLSLENNGGFASVRTKAKKLADPFRCSCTGRLTSGSYTTRSTAFPFRGLYS